MVGLLLHAEEYRGKSQRAIWLTNKGLQTTFQRISSKEPTPTPPLFGTSELYFKSSSAATDALFIQEWLSLRERRGLSRPYSRLTAASYLALFLRENAGILPDPEPIYELGTTAYDALEKAVEPLVVIFKALYKTAFMEGFPVKEDWLYRLNPQTLQEARVLIENPTDAPELQDIPTPDVQNLIQKLQLWLAHHTEFKLPASL